MILHIWLTKGARDEVDIMHENSCVRYFRPPLRRVLADLLKSLFAASLVLTVVKFMSLVPRSNMLVFVSCSMWIQLHIHDSGLLRTPLMKNRTACK